MVQKEPLSCLIYASRSIYVLRPQPAGAINPAERKLLRMWGGMRMGQKVQDTKNKTEKVEAEGHRGVRCSSQPYRWPFCFGQVDEAGVLAAVTNTCSFYWCATYMCGHTRAPCPALPENHVSCFIHLYELLADRHRPDVRPDCQSKITLFCGSGAPNPLFHRWLECIGSLKCWLGFSLQTGRWAHLLTGLLWRAMFFLWML